MSAGQGGGAVNAGAGGGAGAGDAAGAGAPGAAGGGGRSGDAGKPAGAGAAGAGGDDIASLRAKVAELEAARAKDAEAKAAADKAAADKVEADRVAALTADQKRDEALAAQRADIDKTKAELVAERRALALERLGVLPHFRAYAPQVDPKTPDGAKDLEKWVKEHPEAVSRSDAPVQAIKPAGALAELLSGTRSSPLLRGKWAEKLINSVKG